MVMAIVLAAILASIAIVSLRYQFRTFDRLSHESFASEDRVYLKSQARRRTFNAALLLILACMLAGSYLSGSIHELGRIASLKQQDPPTEPTEEDREFVRAWAWFWIAFLCVLLTVVLIAIADSFATTIHSRTEIRRLATEQHELLVRDLVMHRQAKRNERFKPD